MKDIHREFTEDEASDLYKHRSSFTTVPNIKHRFYSPPSKENACGYYAFAAVMGFITLDKLAVEKFVIFKLSEAGVVVTRRIGDNYPGLPLSVALDWGKALGIHVSHFEYMQEMAETMDEKFIDTREYGVYLL